MNNDYDVVTLGSATVDLFADTKSDLIRIDTPSHHESLIAFPLGSKILVNGLEIQTGGGGTNTATAFARLGLRTAFLGKIGDDANGSLIKEKLAAEKIDFVGGEHGVSGVSIVLNSFANDRAILAYKGTNNFLKLEDVAPFTARWIYLSSMMDESLETAKAVIAKHQGKVAFNPSNYQAEMGYEALRDIIDHVDFLVMNREEASKLLGLDSTELRPIPELFKALRKLPPPLIVVTDGSKGAYIYDRKVVYHAKPSPNLVVKETTGAGDAFASTFTAALANDCEIRQAILWAITNSESVLKFRGAKEKLLTREELMAQLENSSVCIDIIAYEKELISDSSIGDKR
jgi:ribokinase